MVKSVMTGDKEDRGYSITWAITEGTGDWRKVRALALQTSGQSVPDGGKSRCKCPEVGKILRGWRKRIAIWPVSKGGAGGSGAQITHCCWGLGGGAWILLQVKWEPLEGCDPEGAGSDLGSDPGFPTLGTMALMWGALLGVAGGWAAKQHFSPWEPLALLPTPSCDN